MNRHEQRGTLQLDGVCESVKNDVRAFVAQLIARTIQRKRFGLLGVPDHDFPAVQ